MGIRTLRKKKVPSKTQEGIILSYLYIEKFPHPLTYEPYLLFLKEDLNDALCKILRLIILVPKPNSYLYSMGNVLP